MAKKILIIEDDVSLAENLSGALRDNGFLVTIANDGESGFRQAQEGHPDLILLDLVLPKKHGLKVLEDLNQDAGLKTIPVIVLTNLEDSTDIEGASSFGIKAYLVKANYSLPEIVEKIKEVLPPA